ncbi:MAG: FHA domain-containing protein [Acidobacteriota bacterium]
MTRESLKPRFTVLQDGKALGSREIEPGEDWKVGRQTGNPLVVSHPSVSRFHARILCDASGVYLEDQNTANGSYVNEVRVQDRVCLKDGDLIRLGQTTSENPIMLSFEDPSSRLLEALAESDKPARPPEPEPPAPAQAAGESVGEAQEPAEAQAPADEAGSKLPAPIAKAIGIVKQPVVWIPAAVLVLAVIVGLWFVLGLEATQKPWQSVRIEPPKVQSGWNMALRGPEIEPSETLKVWVRERQAKIDKMGDGFIELTVPDLDIGEIGVQSFMLRVERKGVVVWQQAIQYETVPLIRSAPAEVAVGQVIELQGTGLGGDPSRVQVRIGQMPAQVITAGPGSIQVRVPVLTRSGVVDAPLEVAIGEWVAPSRMLKVRPRDLPCFPMDFAAEYVAEQLWEIRYALGTALYVEGAAAAAGAGPPRPVLDAINGLKSVFEKAHTDPTARFEIRDSGASQALFGTGSTFRPVEITRWSPSVLNMVKARTQYNGVAALVPHWIVIVLNDVLGLFGKGQAPQAGSGRQAILKKLYDSNIANGGNGCPGVDDVQALTPADREQFQQASWAIPNSFGVIEGLWTGNLENVFYPERTDVTPRLRLSLNQKGMALSGSATVEEVRPQGIRWSPPAIPGVHGSLVLGGQPRIELTFPANKPFKMARLTGVLQGDSIAGTFTTSDGKRGSFRLSRGGG